MQVQHTRSLHSSTHHYLITLIPNGELNNFTNVQKNLEQKNSMKQKQKEIEQNEKKSSSNKLSQILLIQMNDIKSHDNQQHDSNIHKQQRSKKVLLPFPCNYELSQGQIPKTLIDQIVGTMTSKSIDQKERDKERGKQKMRENQIRVQPIYVNYYTKVCEIRWFVCPISSWGKESKVDFICGGADFNQIKIISLNQFRNYKEFQFYFYRQNQQIQNLIKHLDDKCRDKYNLVLQGIFHLEQNSNKERQCIIDSLYLICVCKVTGNMLQQHKLPQQKVRKICQGSKISVNSCLLKQTWQGLIDFQIKLKNLIRKLTYSSCYFQSKNRQQQLQIQYSTSYLRRCHFIVKFRLCKQGIYTVVVYNNLKIIEDCIAYSLSSLSHQQANSYLCNQYDKLSATHRLKYPLQYYLRLCQQSFQFNSYLQILTRQQPTQQNMPYQHIPAEQAIIISKYTLLQNIQIKHELPALLKQKHKILQLPLQHLQSDPCCLTIILYWLVSPPGSNKSIIFANLKSLLLEYQVNVVQFHDFVMFQKQFMGYFNQGNMKEVIFGKERFCFCFVCFWFDVERFFYVVGTLAVGVPKNVFYELFLVTTSTSETSHFASNLEDIKASTQGKQCYRITTSYHFSIDYLLCCLLKVQTRPFSSKKPYGQSTKSLSQILHYISSTYANIDFKKVIQNCDAYGGQVKLIEYSTKERAKINWDEVDDYQRQQIQDQLKILLEGSYKKISSQDALTAYFLGNIEELEFQFDVVGVAEQIVDQTFVSLSYFDL